MAARQIDTAKAQFFYIASVPALQPGAASISASLFTTVFSVPDNRVFHPTSIIYHGLAIAGGPYGRPCASKTEGLICITTQAGADVLIR